METNAILDRVQAGLHLKSDKELADYLKLTKGAIHNWRARGRLDYEQIILICENLDLNWIFFGVSYEGDRPEPLFTQPNREIEALYKRVETLEEEKREYWALIKKLTDK